MSIRAIDRDHFTVSTPAGVYSVNISNFYRTGAHRLDEKQRAYLHNLDKIGRAYRQFVEADGRARALNELQMVAQNDEVTAQVAVACAEAAEQMAYLVRCLEWLRQRDKLGQAIYYTARDTNR